MTPAHVQDHQPSNAQIWRLLALSLLSLLIVRLAALYATSINLFFDEAQYWDWSRDLAFGYFSKPPFLAWAIRGATEVCGQSEFCIRLPSPLIHTATSIFIFLAGRELYGPRTGLWSAIVFATLPGISYSAGLISTDIPLLLFWTASLFFWIKLLKTHSWIWASALGISLGFGLMSKYAMAYFILCACIHILIDKDSRWLLTSPKSLATLALAAILLTPNILWNIQNSFVTLSHTADNAKWGGSLIHPNKALEFFAAQFGVFGPILFAALLVIVWRLYKNGLNNNDRLLITFAIPVILLITTQALLSRAHANWAAVAYPAASILVTATMLRDEAKSWFRASLGLHLAIIVTLALGLSFSSKITLPTKIDPFKRVTGWNKIADATRKHLSQQQFSAILTANRAFSAELVYYMRDQQLPVLAWRPYKRPRDHFELTRAFTNTSPEPLLFVSPHANSQFVTAGFSSIVPLGKNVIITGKGSKRTVYYFALSGFKNR